MIILYIYIGTTLIILFTYIASFTAEAISKGLDDAKWEQHLSDLKAYRYYDWLGLYQDLIDEAAARVG